MIGGTPTRAVTTVRQQARETRRLSILAWAAALSVGLLLAAVAWRTAGRPLGFAALGVAVTGIAWIIRPTVGLHLTVFFALIGDIKTVSWFPFNKNLSSQESILYLGDRLTISPLELILAGALILTVVRRIAAQGLPTRGGALLPALCWFAFMVFVGLVYGVGKGGDLRIAIFESRGLLYLPIVYLLAINVLDHDSQHRRLVWTVVAAVVVQSVLSLQYYAGLSPVAQADVDTLNEHGSSLGMALVLLLAVASWTLRRCSLPERLLLTLAAAPVGAMFLIAQRRAAVVGLVVAFVLLAITLFWRQRRTFVRVVPIAAVMAVGYTGVFWNASGSLAFPAQAIKTIVAPDERTAADQSSDVYRIIENVNLIATIHAAPVTGLGFGQRFLRPVPLPDISFFEFHEFIPHNSILWIWIKTGFVGFVSMFFLFGSAIACGARRIRGAPEGSHLLVALGGTSFVMIYAIFAYVDIAWDARNMVLLGTMFALLAPARLRTSHRQQDELVQDAPARPVPVASTV